MTHQLPHRYCYHGLLHQPRTCRDPGWCADHPWQRQLVSDLPRYHVIDPVLIYGGYSSTSESNITAGTSFGGQFSNSSLRPVANYVTRPRLQQKIKEQLPVIQGIDEQDTRILVIYGLGGSGKSQLALNFLRTCRGDY